MGPARLVSGRASFATHRFQRFPLEEPWCDVCFVACSYLLRNTTITQCVAATGYHHRMQPILWVILFLKNKRDDINLPVTRNVG